MNTAIFARIRHTVTNGNLPEGFSSRKGMNMFYWIILLQNDEYSHLCVQPPAAALSLSTELGGVSYRRAAARWLARNRSRLSRHAPCSSSRLPHSQIPAPAACPIRAACRRQTPRETGRPLRSCQLPRLDRRAHSKSAGRPTPTLRAHPSSYIPTCNRTQREYSEGQPADR